MKPHVERRPACRPSERGSHLPLAPVTKSGGIKIVDELILDLVARSDLEFVRLCFGVTKRRRNTLGALLMGKFHSQSPYFISVLLLTFLPPADLADVSPVGAEPMPDDRAAEAPPTSWAAD